MLSVHSAPACGGKVVPQAPKGGFSSMRLWQDWPLARPPPIPLRGTSPRESVSRDFRVAIAPLQITFACHPYAGGRIKPLRLPVVSYCTKLSTHSPTALAGERWCRQAPKGAAASGGIYTGAEGAHHNPHGQRPCQTFEPFAPFEPSRPPGRVPFHRSCGPPPPAGRGRPVF
jgi:hypothetical protein